MTYLENPSNFPKWVCQYPDNEQYQQLRGLPAFELLEQEVGIRVQYVIGGDPNEKSQIEIVKPWTFLFMPVPITDFAESRKRLDVTPCAVIMDCTFPIMNLENAFVIDRPDGMFDLIESREVVLNNLRLADLVTVPRPGWAFDLAAELDNVFLLPDLVLSEGDGDDELTDRDMEALNKFLGRLSEAGAQAAANRGKRPCTCDECAKKRLHQLADPGT